MTINQYIKEYTAGKEIIFGDVISEVRELIVEIVKINKEGIKEEFGDVFHFLQLWLYWKFGLNGEIWKISRNSVQKFMDRKMVWNKIYVFAGLDENISGYAGNYKKVEKVVNHLRNFGIVKEKAEEAHKTIVAKQV